MASEFSRIAALQALFGPAPQGTLGIGDDAAVLPSARDLVATVDVSVEGVHFSRDWLSLDAIAARAIEAALSDVAAMGARVDVPGCGLLLAWTLPRSLTDTDVALLAAGSLAAARRAETFIVGGNLAASPSLSLTTTVLARADGPVVARSGARPGDVVAVTGVVGAAALGLRSLQRRITSAEALPMIERWTSPRARLSLGFAQRARASAMIDLSDGLAQDAGHLARASGVRLVLEAERLPMLPTQRAVAAAWGLDADALALTGGEDYELLATGRAEDFDAHWTIIGRVEEGDGVQITRSGAVLTAPEGFDHFV